MILNWEAEAKSALQGMEGHFICMVSYFFFLQLILTDAGDGVGRKELLTQTAGSGSGSV